MLHHGTDAQKLPKTVRETQAEAVAFVVCRGVGLETNTAAADYIALYNGDKKTLGESLSVIQQTAARILDDLTPERQPASQPSPAPQPSDSRDDVSPAPRNEGPNYQPSRVSSPTSPAHESVDLGR
jgi:hypothetical protein